jgi:hypothetical protein
VEAGDDAQLRLWAPCCWHGDWSGRLRFNTLGDPQKSRLALCLWNVSRQIRPRC